MTKSYLNFLIDRIVIHTDRIEIKAKLEGTGPHGRRPFAQTRGR
jgi:hypothetical protein